MNQKTDTHTRAHKRTCINCINYYLIETRQWQKPFPVNLAASQLNFTSGNISSALKCGEARITMNVGSTRRYSNSGYSSRSGLSTSIKCCKSTSCPSRALPCSVVAMPTRMQTCLHFQTPCEWGGGWFAWRSEGGRGTIVGTTISASFVSS